MNLKHLPTLILSTLIGWSVNAQMKLCKPGDVPPNNCRDACLYCNIDGLKGRNTIPKGSLPATFCTPTTDNAQWIPFVAGSRELTVEVSVFECVRGSGLELGLFNGIECASMATISTCFTDANNNTSAKLVSVLPLTIGDIYWLLIDGNIGDICSWQVKVTEGTTVAPDLKNGGDLFLPSKTCINQTFSAFFTPPVGTKLIEWKINDKVINNQNRAQLFYTPENSGYYKVCATASNACHQAPPYCKTILVGQLNIDTLTNEICPSEGFVFNDSLYFPGLHDVFIKRPNLCDSLVVLKINPSGKNNSVLLSSKIQIKEGDHFKLLSKTTKPIPSDLVIATRDSLLCTFCNKLTYQIKKNDTLFYEWTNEQNCKINEPLYIEMIPVQKILLPNIIRLTTENNRNFTPVLLQPERHILESLQLYNRWGNLVCTTTNADNQFDEFCGKCVEGVYIWQAILSEKSDGKRHVEYGTLVIQP